MRLKRLISIVLLVAFVLVPMPAFADEVDHIPYATYFTDEQLSSFEIGEWLLDGEGISFVDNRNPATYGLITDYSDLVNIDLDFYSDVYGVEDSNTFLPNASIAYSKLFSTNPYSSMTVADLADWITANDGLVGYNIRLNYVDEEQGSLLTEGTKVILDLSFPLTIYGGEDYNYNYSYRTSDGRFYRRLTSSSGEDYPSINYLDTDYVVLFDDSLPDYHYGGARPRSYLSNTVEILATTSNGEISTLATYTDVSAINGSFDILEDTEFVTVSVSYGFSDSTLMSQLGTVINGVTFRFFNVDVSGTVEVEKQDESIGLIKGIIEWLKSILNAILELPQNIANKVSDAITALFVPSADDMAGVYENATGLLEDRLGFIAQIVGWVLELFDTLVSTVRETQETITVPRLALPWPSDLPSFAQVAGNEIVIWEEFTFDIIPQGMDSLRNLLETVTSLWAVLALVMCCLDSYHGFVGEAPMYRSSMEYQNTKDIAEEITGFRRKEHLGRRRW